MKKIIVLLGIFCIIMGTSLIHSCKKSVSSCGDVNYSPKFHATKVQGETTTSENGTLRFSDFQFYLQFSGQHYSQKVKTFDLFPSAYACSPVEPYTEEKIKNIIIISNEDFDETHPAGTDLKDLFEIAPYMSGRITSVSEYLNRKPVVENALFQLIKSPKQRREFTFTVTYHFEGKLAQQLEYQTVPVTLLPE